MALPPRPTAPAQALRSNPDTFSLNAELAINYQWTTFPDWIEAMGDFVVARAEEANAAALTGDITPAPEFAAYYLRLNSGGTALEYRSPTETAGDLGQYGRNLIINGSGRINQRGYVSGAATSGANQFTLDRWFVVTSGQNLSFTGDASGRVMTAPAGGARQVVEGANIIGGSYVLNWTGTATATVNGTARTKGEVFTLTANTNVVVAFVGGTFTDVQLERGSVVTPFEWRSVGQELALCQRYYWRGLPAAALNYPSYASNAVMTWAILFPVTMRAAPVFSSDFTGVTLTSTGTPSWNQPTQHGGRLVTTSTGTVNNAVISFAAGNYLDADAELTS